METLEGALAYEKQQKKNSKSKRIKKHVGVTKVRNLPIFSSARARHERLKINFYVNMYVWHDFLLRYTKDKEVDKKRKRQPRNDNEVEEESTFSWKCDHYHRNCKARIRIRGDLCVKDFQGEHTCGQEPNTFRPEIADVITI